MTLLDRFAEWLVPAAQAHEKWFVSPMQAHPPAPDLFRTFNAPVAIAVAVIVALLIVVWRLDRAYERSQWYAQVEELIHPYRDAAAPLLGICTGFVLLWSTIHGTLLVPNFSLPGGVAGTVLASVQALIGLLLMIGLFAPAAAAGLLALYAASFALYPPLEPVDYLHFAGIGIFLLFFARGRYSLDWFLGKPILSSPRQRKWAYLVLRVLTGVALTWLGLWKFIRPDLHFTLMDLYPDFNPYVMLGWFGISMSREVYVLCLAVTETLIGIAVTLGLFTRVAAVMLLPIMCVSVIFLGWGEMAGHLPILGTLVVMAVYGDTYHKYRNPERKPLAPHA